MKVFDLILNQEINPIRKSKTTGTDMVMQLLVGTDTISNVGFGIKNCTFGGGIRLNCGKPIIFDSCYFNRTTFSDCNNIKFINCEFIDCYIGTSFDITLEKCEGDLYIYNSSGSYDVFDSNIKIKGITANDIISGSSVKLKISNCPQLEDFNSAYQQYLKKQEEIKEKIKTLVGYKIVHMPVLVELTFPEDALIANLDDSKSRASKAFVKGIYPIKNFEEVGVTNYDYYPNCDYKLNKFVYPDSFNTGGLCNHGIHFCTDINKLLHWGNINANQLGIAKKLIKHE